MKPAVSLLVCLYAYTALSAGAIAQIQIGTVTGTVVDPAGAFLSLDRLFANDRHRCSRSLQVSQCAIRSLHCAHKGFWV
jgi:hypothetical protein